MGNIKSITSYYLEINGDRIKFRTKKLAIKSGKQAIKISKNVKLIETYILWWLHPNETKIIDKQEFDRSILIKMK